MTTINRTIQSLTTFETAQDLRALLAETTPTVRMTLLKGKIESLDDEIEIDIQNENVDLAIFKLSQMVLLEEELRLVERLVLKTAVRNL